jgi:LPXTG-site transpeptidase (sortase) family protein
MGYIEIPSISQKLPIYHYTDDKELAQGIGHIASSSLPIGGESTNCVLTGHRGLPNNLLITRLDEVDKGDMIYVTNLDTIKAYKVYKTKVILPEETNDLIIEEGRDLLTLITCTPYGVNTHRLILWAERVEFNEDKYEPITTMQAMTQAIPLTRLYISAAFIIILIVLSKVLDKRNRKTESREAKSEGNTDGNL